MDWLQFHPPRCNPFEYRSEPLQMAERPLGERLCSGTIWMGSRIASFRNVPAVRPSRDLSTDEHAKRLITIPGIQMVFAVAIMAAIGPIERVTNQKQLVNYFSLNPSIHQSGNGPVRSRPDHQARTWRVDQSRLGRRSCARPVARAASSCGSALGAVSTRPPCAAQMGSRATVPMASVYGSPSPSTAAIATLQTTQRRRTQN